MMNGKEKLYFLIDKIDDIRTIAPTNQPLIIDPLNDLNKKYREVELAQLFAKLDKDEHILVVLKIPQRIKNELEEFDPYDHADDGCWHIKLLPAYDEYYLKIKHEPEYQKFTGKKPPAPSKTNLSRKSLEKIWNLLQEIEDKRGITPPQDDITIPQVHLSKVKNDREAREATQERITILRKLETQENAVTNIRCPVKQEEYIRLRIGLKYFETFDYYQNEYKRIAEEYQRTQQALRPILLPKQVDHSVTNTNSQEFVKEFSPQNYPFVLMVLRQIVKLVEFSPNNEVNYQLQSPAGQLLIQERTLLDKLQSKKLLRNLGEDGIFGIVTLNNIDAGLIKQVISEMESRESGVISQDEFEEIKLQHKYMKLLDELNVKNTSGLKERYDNLINDIKGKSEDEIEKTPKREVDQAALWSNDFKWQGRRFVFGQFGSIVFNSKTRQDLFRELTTTKGNWVTVKKLEEVTNKTHDYVRPTIGQIERGMKQELKKHISLVSTEENSLLPKPTYGAYRIKFTP